MKFNYKLNLGNIVGVVANIAPEVAGKIDTSKLSDMVIEGSAEYSVGEMNAAYGLTRQIIKDLPEILEDLAEAALSFRAIDEIFDEVDSECDGCHGCDTEDNYTIITRDAEGNTKEINIAQAMSMAQEANESLFGQLQKEKAKNKELRKKLYGAK